MKDQQAFPHGDPTHGGDIGMTLRDWFAGQALAGAMASPNLVVTEYSQIARELFEMADAMLAEREKRSAELNREGNG
jgi:hypothetical protein